MTDAGRDDAPQLADTPGAGAAGGLGFPGLVLGGHTVSGADYFLDLLDFQGALSDCDVVITGEGRMDSQTQEGKLPAAVAGRSGEVPVLAIVGRADVDTTTATAIGFTPVYALVDHCETNPANDAHLSGKLLEHLAKTIDLPERHVEARHAEP